MHRLEIHSCTTFSLEVDERFPGWVYDKSVVDGGDLDKVRVVSMHDKENLGQVHKRLLDTFRY